MDIRFLVAVTFLGLSSVITSAQTSAFTYQGRLTDGAAPASGTYQMTFTLFDQMAAGGTPQAPTITNSLVSVANGLFSVSLDFAPAAPFTNGAPIYLEIGVRRASDPAGTPFTTLTPRQSVTSSPFSIRSVSAAAADTAANASNLGGVAAGQYVLTGDSRLSDARVPTAGSTNYVQNTTAQQFGSNFNISGQGTAGSFNAGTEFRIAGNRILAGSAGNVFAGGTAGIANSSGVLNSFFGDRAGEANQGGSSNSFFGERSGLNSQGVNNSFFGAVAGQTNVTGGNNTVVGTLADVGAPNLNFATAVGAGAVVSSSNTVVLGRSSDTVQIPGTLVVNGSALAASPIFGDGSDGDVNVTNGALLTRDMYYHDLTIGGGQILDPNGYRVFVSGTLTLSAGARIERDGFDGNGSSQGLAEGTLGRSAPGGNISQSSITNSLGGSGGANGSAGGTATAPAVSVGGAGVLRVVGQAVIGRSLDSARVTGGAGGAGFGGGIGGGVVLLVARTIVLSGGVAQITAKGGNGTGGASGGGGGGVVIVITTTPQPAGLTLSAMGGNGVNGGSSGLPGYTRWMN